MITCFPLATQFSCLQIPYKFIPGPTLLQSGTFFESELKTSSFLINSLDKLANSSGPPPPSQGLFTIISSY